MPVATPPVWSDPTTATVDVATGGIWTAAAIDILCSDLATLGGVDGASGTAGKVNQLSNGGFEVWQRGAGPFTAGAYGPDRWFGSLGSGSALSVSRDSAVPDTGSKYDANLTYTHVANSNWLQNLENFLQLTGRPITFTVRCKTSTANAVTAVVTSAGPGAISVISAAHPGDGAYHTLTVTATIPASVTQLQVGLGLAATCACNVDNAMLVTGSSPSLYQPMPYADDLARCLRYYEVIGAGSNAVIVEGIATAAGQSARANLPYKALKATGPTITIVGTWSLTNASGQPTAQGDASSMFLSLVSSAAGQFNALANTTGTYITLTGDI